jgi:hypothetical protein
MYTPHPTPPPPPTRPIPTPPPRSEPSAPLSRGCALHPGPHSDPRTRTPTVVGWLSLSLTLSPFCLSLSLSLSQSLSVLLLAPRLPAAAYVLQLRLCCMVLRCALDLLAASEPPAPLATHFRPPPPAPAC